MADTGGFEPPVEFNPDPSLAVKSIRPLWHVSIRCFQQNLAYPKIGECSKTRELLHFTP